MKFIYSLVRIMVVLFYYLYLSEIVQLDWKPNILFYLKVLGVYFTVSLLIDFAELIIVFLYRRRRKMPWNKTDNFILGVWQISIMLTVIAFAGGVLALFKVGVKEFITSISIVAAALAILFKEYISNIINSIIITFSNQISVDDYLVIGEHKGKVIDITMQTITLLNDDDDVVMVPNSTVYNHVIVNYSKGDIRKTSIDFQVPYDGFNSVGEFEAILKSSLAEYSEYIDPNSYQLRTEEIYRNYVKFKFQFVLINYNKEMKRICRRTVLRCIVNVVKKRAILPSNHHEDLEDD